MCVVGGWLVMINQLWKKYELLQFVQNCNKKKLPKNYQVIGGAWNRFTKPWKKLQKTPIKKPNKPIQNHQRTLWFNHEKLMKKNQRKNLSFVYITL